jgi:hypothetical protein
MSTAMDETVEVLFTWLICQIFTSVMVPHLIDGINNLF